MDTLAKYAVGTDCGTEALRINFIPQRKETEHIMICLLLRLDVHI